MIVVKIKHGLGNQLFQYATARSLAIRLSCPLKFDISHFNKSDKRQFELSYFDLPSEITANIEECSGQTFSLYNEPHFHFDEKLKTISSNVYLDGFWQSEKYFVEHRAILMKDLRIRKEYLKEVEFKVKEIQYENAVCIHIRRGDYTTKPFVDVFGVLPLAYYQRALHFLEEQVKQFKIYFFSDDIDWVKSNLHVEQEHEFISGDITKTTIEDLYLMTKCKHYIIANSSFSWWAAWLSQHHEKLVIAPKQWFLNAPYNTIDVVPGDWIRM